MGVTGFVHGCLGVSAGAKTALALGLTACLLGVPDSPATAGAVIFNGGTPANSTVALGVNDQGHLNFSSASFSTSNASATGLAFKFPDGSWRDSTAPGCLCEGWGVAVTTQAGDRVAGYASVANGGVAGLTSGIFGATPTSATSTLALSSASIAVSHAYGVSLSSSVFQGNVTVRNFGTTMVRDLVYRRAMDWDVPPTEFSEFVTHQGVTANLESNGGNVRYASDNGFAIVDPRVPASSIMAGTVNTDFVDRGRADHGSVFDFAFGDLAPGATRNFNIFYGAFANESAANAAVALLKPNVWSLGQSSTEGTPATYLFAFGGVGGVAPGLDPRNPVLPFVPAPGQFFFSNPEPRRWYDPPYAEGFVYTLLDDPTAVFTEVGVPDASFGFGDLILRVGALSFVLAPGATFDFLANGLSDVTTFEIVGLSRLLDIASPGFPFAFPTFLDFTGAPNISMIAIIAAPLPGTLVILFAGLGGLLWTRRPSVRLKAV